MSDDHEHNCPVLRGAHVTVQVVHRGFSLASEGLRFVLRLERQIKDPFVSRGERRAVTGPDGRQDLHFEYLFDLLARPGDPI